MHEDVAVTTIQPYVLTSCRADWVVVRQKNEKMEENYVKGWLGRLGVYVIGC